MNWRKIANSVIKTAVVELHSIEPNPDKLFKQISKKSYPFGHRSQWPYKIWLSAIKEHKSLYVKLTQQRIDPTNYKIGLFED